MDGSQGDVLMFKKLSFLLTLMPDSTLLMDYRPVLQRKNWRKMLCIGAAPIYCGVIPKT